MTTSVVLFASVVVKYVSLTVGVIVRFAPALAVRIALACATAAALT